MKEIKISYLVLLALLSVLWLMADAVLTNSSAFFPFRASIINYTGILGMGVMSVGMILSARPVRLEPLLGGLDKMYRLHKWLGITGLVIVILHWSWVKAPKWMVGWGWLERPVRAPASEQPLALFRFFQSQRGLAEDVGEWAFYAAVVLIVLALVKRFPYRYFFKTHRLLAVAYLVLVFHSLVLMKFSYWGEVIGPFMAVLMLAGTVAALVSLFRTVGHDRRAVGVIEQLVHYPDNRVLNVSVMLKDPWPGHEAGQFAFVTFDPHEGPHPFTLSSAWAGDGKLSFDIKGIGDYTDTLPATLKVGDGVKVEGPYGRFDFSSNKPCQIWVAGGIGITPFIARMRALADEERRQAITLFYSTQMPDEEFISNVRALADRAKVQLRLLVTTKDGPLNAERLCQWAPEWKDADLWFCGPSSFGRALRQNLVAKGLATEDFHFELFDMR
ncbi:MAG: ferric reductase-like transmembrane domain-containing protein [Candidatus Contendobacter sp.]|nr:ferric reductase-like transmembrane domain-containing protein [Candidatus Contendobacter sp.]